MNLEIGGETYDLQFDGAAWQLTRSSTGEIVPLDLGEYFTLERLGKAAGRALERGGLRSDPTTDLAKAIDGIRSQFDEDQLAVLLDTTGVRDAILALRSPAAFGPLNLLDLALLTTAVVLYDVVILQPVSGLLDEAPDLFVPLRFSRTSIRDDLWELCAGQREWRRSEEENLSARWQEFLRLKTPPRIDLGAFEEYQDSPDTWDGVPASFYMHFALRDLPTDPTKLNEFLSIQTLRTFYNDRLGGLVNVPYMPAAMRAPAISQLWAEKESERASVDLLFRQIASSSKKTNEQADDGPFMRPVAAPPLLSTVLTRMETRADYWRVVMDLRVEFEGFRKAVRADRKALTGDSPKFLRRYVQHLSDATHSIQLDGVTTDAAATGVAVVVAPAAVPEGLFSIATKLASNLAVPALRSAFNRLFRPDIYVIANVAAEAQRLENLRETVARLWPEGWSRGDYETLERLSAAQPLSVLRLAQPG